MGRNTNRSDLRSSIKLDLHHFSDQHLHLVTSYYLGARFKSQKQLAVKFCISEKHVSVTLKKAREVLRCSDSRTLKTLLDVQVCIAQSIGVYCSSITSVMGTLRTNHYIRAGVHVECLSRLVLDVTQRPVGWLPVDETLKTRPVRKVLQESWVPKLIVLQAGFDTLKSEWRAAQRPAEMNGVGRLKASSPLAEYVISSSFIDHWWHESDELWFVTKESRLYRSAAASFSVNESIGVRALTSNLERFLFRVSADLSEGYGYPTIETIEDYLRSTRSTLCDELDRLTWFGGSVRLSREQKLILSVIRRQVWDYRPLVERCREESLRRGIHVSDAWLKRELQYGSLVYVDKSLGARKYRYCLVGLKD